MSQVYDISAGVRTICKYSFSADTIQKGLAYHAQGRVLSSNVLVHKDNLHINASVNGSIPKPYLIEARLYRKKAGLLVEAVCTCPVGFFCKHIVAAIADVFGRDGLKLFDIHHARVSLEPPEKLVEVPAQSLGWEFKSWMESLQNSDVAPLRLKTAKTLVYLIDATTPRLRLRVMECARLKAGGLGRPAACKRIDLSETSALPAAELAILRQLVGAQGSGYGAEFSLHGTLGSQAVRQFLDTGKCHFNQVAHESPLKAGPPRPGVMQWTIDARGWQVPQVALQPAATTVLPLDPPLYIDTQAGQCGLVESTVTPARLARWLSAPSVPPEQSPALASCLAPLGLPAPTRIPVMFRQVRPTPVLRLFEAVLKSPIYDWNAPPEQRELSRLPLARFSLEYAGTAVDYFDDDSQFNVYRDGKVERITRDKNREDRHYDELAHMGLDSASEVYSHDLPDEFFDDGAFETAPEWMGFVTDAIPKLRQRGWRIDIDPGFPYQFAKVEDWYSQTQRDETLNDWFSLELGILVDGQKFNLLPMIRGVLEHLESLRAAQRFPEFIDVRMADGRFVQLPAQRVLDIGRTLAELYDPDSLVDGQLKVSRLRAAELTDIPGTGQWKGDQELRDLARKLAAYSGIQRLAPPKGLQATLRPYQLEGVAWLQFLREYSFGGILADDMGLGKTVQVLAHLVIEKESGRANLPSLVVAPTSLMANWRAETERFAPGLRVLVSHGSGRKEHFERLADYDLIVTSYSLLPRDEEILKKQPFHSVILDEAQYVKNPNTKWADVARNLSARHRLCMTGTPMENHLGELWSLMTFLSPGYLGTQKQFGRAYRTPIEKHGDQDRRKALGQRLRPFILRRRKEEVALDLPPKTEILRTIELDGPQRDLYETIRLAMHERVRQEVEKHGLNRSHIIILDALLKLRQACCDPRLVKLEQARKVKNSAKLEFLMDMLPELLDEGRRVLLFSQFTSMLDLIESEVVKRKIRFVRLDGSTADRATPVRRFQALEAPLFLISLKAGGTGLNLTAADTVIHFDPWWNPAVEQQATDRAHRIGQDKPVFVYKLVTQGTVEEKIVAMQDRKRELVAGLLGEGSQQNLQLSKDDLDHLFDPIQNP